MEYRIFPRTGWQISEIGLGMWGMGSWTGSDDAESLASLNLAVDLGCNFFDTAFNYNKGHSERLLGELLRQHPDKKLYTATKLPPKNFIWPSTSEFTLDETFPAEHMREYTEISLKNIGVDCIDLLYFHTWDDSWAADERWQKAVLALKEEGLIKSFGISVNRWEHLNIVKALETGLIDAIQVVYSVFDQAPEFELFPLCEKLKVAVVARVPFDEGSLTGNLNLDSKWPENDFRFRFFKGDNLKACVARADALRPLLPEGMSMAELALRFILSNPTVTSVIPGMRKEKHVRENAAVSDGKPLSSDLITELRPHRWDRNLRVWNAK